MIPAAQGSAAKQAARPRIEGDRENEILEATLDLLAEVGYDRLTMDAVATASKASKATLYRRWESKSDLVLDALERAKGAPHPADVDTGNLRGDLLAIGCIRGGLNDRRSLTVMSSVMTALQRDDDFCTAFHERFLAPKVAQTRRIYERAIARGEIDADIDLELHAPILAGVILHRSFVLKQPVDDAIVAQIIDEIVIPAATSKNRQPA